MKVERPLFESAEGSFKLTERSIRKEVTKFGRTSIKSILLKDITGSQVTYVDQFAYLWAAGLLSVAGAAGAMLTGSVAALVAGLILSSAFALAYMDGRYRALKFSSASSSIVLKATELELDEMTSLIEKVEAAKNAASDEEATMPQRRIDRAPRERVPVY